ncbi:unnamed protein product [Closterium sp. Naga37s-1]|nr:unnamed protein product [Closterium sp. Naga37s-1]
MGLTYTTWAATNPCTLDGTTGKAGEWERVSCTAFGRAYVIALCACLSSARASPLRVPLLCACLSSARASPLCVPLLCAFLSSARVSPLRVSLLCACLSSARASPLRVPLLCACLYSARASTLRVPLLYHALLHATLPAMDACCPQPHVVVLTNGPLSVLRAAAALLSIKSAMGLTYTTWAATNPCTLDGTTGKAGEWERVSCTVFGRAYVINLDSAGLQRKSFPADISKLTGLGAV